MGTEEIRADLPDPDPLPDGVEGPYIAGLADVVNVGDVLSYIDDEQLVRWAARLGNGPVGATKRSEAITAMVTASAMGLRMTGPSRSVTPGRTSASCRAAGCRDPSTLRPPPTVASVITT